MADITKIKLGSTDYDIKDSTARTTLNFISNMVMERKIIIFGDSYLSDVTVGNLDTNVRTELTDYLNDTNVSFELHSDGGESFGTTGNNSFLYDVTNFTSEHPADEITDVFFCGGYNDRIYTQLTVESGMIATFAKVREKWQNAKISVFHFGWSSTLASTERDKIVNVSLPAYRNAALYGAAYAQNSEYTMHDYENYITSDYFHPNAEGMRQIAKQIALYILTGNCDVHYNWRSYTFSNGADNTGTDYTVSARLDNDIVTMAIHERNVAYTTPFNLSPGTVTRMLQLVDITPGTRSFMLGMNDDEMNKWYGLPLAGYLQYNNNKFADFSGMKWFVKGGFLQVRSQKIASDYNGWLSMPNVSYIHPTGQSVIIPTLCC